MRAPRITLDDLHAHSGAVIGTWSQMASGDVIDALGAAGYHFTIIDTEHGAFGIETAEQMIRACEAAGLAALVRVPRGDTTALYKSLDAGAAGVVLPSVASADEAQRLVAAARFAPEGQRGACPIVRAADHSAQPWPAFTARQQGTGVIAMIETAEGLAQCEAICATPGLKALMLGPFDLSVSLGEAGNVKAASVQAALDRLIAAAQAARLPVWMPVFSADETVLRADIAHWQARGIRHFAIGADKIVLAQALARYRLAANVAQG
jgi:4-hydroxy-2-oxoheptanedioate aldolase